MEQVNRRQLLGILMLSLGSLMLEVVLTRVFSVTLWYHFAFLAISLALSGSAVAGILLYFAPSLRTWERGRLLIGYAALALALVIPLTLYAYLHFPFGVLLSGDAAWSGPKVLGFLAIDLLLMLPFLLSGFTLALALTIWSQEAGRLYWADLPGASLGCLASIVALEALGGSGAVLAAAVMAALAGLAFLWGAGGRRRWLWGMLVLLVAVGILVGNARNDWFVITVNKAGGEEPPRVYEKWNAHSRVTVYEPQNYPFFWAVSPECWDETIAKGGTFRHALLLIDAVAGTPIQGYDGLLNQVEFLRCDVTSFAYHVVEAPQTFVIGPGGGRDVLAALASGAPHVTAAEVNPAIVEAVRGPFGDFSGHLYDLPEVTIIVGDARGVIAASRERYDVIQASLIDTWAAGGSGAFALSENSLYTREAFRTYYEHLSDRGVMSVSRWYDPSRPAETMRLLSTAMAGWRSAGVSDPRPNLIVVGRPTSGSGEGLATMLIKRTPFTAEEIERAKAAAERLDVDLLYVPGEEPDNEIGRFIAAEDQEAIIRRYPLDISPATDDRPFFFNLVRIGDLFNTAVRHSFVYRVSVQAIVILLAVIAATSFLSALFILLPLWVGSRKGTLVRPPSRMLGYFSLLGMAFMLVEIPTIQKFTVYLGRPVYSLAIVLFSLLLFGGLGSLWSGRRWDVEGQTPRLLRLLFSAIAGMILLHTVLSFWPLPQTMAWPFPLRLLFTVVLLAPLAFLMGMPFPLGVRWVGREQEGALPWLWGMNGVMSVFGSALGTLVALHWGFRATLLLATLAYLWAGHLFRRERQGT